MTTQVTAGRVDSLSDIRQHRSYLEKTYAPQLKGYVLPQIQWKLDATGMPVVEATLQCITGNRKRRMIGTPIINKDEKIAVGKMFKEADRILKVEAQGGTNGRVQKAAKMATARKPKEKTTTA